MNFKVGDLVLISDIEGCLADSTDQLKEYRKKLYLNKTPIIVKNVTLRKGKIDYCDFDTNSYAASCMSIRPEHLIHYKPKLPTVKPIIILRKSK